MYGFAVRGLEVCVVGCTVRCSLLGVRLGARAVRRCPLLRVRFSCAVQCALLGVRQCALLGVRFVVRCWVFGLMRVVGCVQFVACCAVLCGSVRFGVRSLIALLCAITLRLSFDDTFQTSGVTINAPHA